MKGSWGHHEDHSLKAYFAGKRLLLETFMENKGSDIINADEIITDKTLLNWQESYHKYAQSMMECNCAPTKAIALFMDLMSHWELCQKGYESVILW